VKIELSKNIKGGPYIEFNISGDEDYYSHWHKSSSFLYEPVFSVVEECSERVRIVDKYDKSYALYEKGLAHFENYEYNSALECFKESNELDEHSRTYARIYECLIQLDRINDAKPYIEAAYLKNPKHDKVAIQYAECLLGCGMCDLAKDILLQLLSRNKTYNPAKKLLDKINNKQ
jgi:tetratricopeptide (TPR) repeat protein